MLLQYGHFGTAKLLLDAGCDVNFSDDKGRSPLRAAAQYGHFSTAQVHDNSCMSCCSLKKLLDQSSGLSLDTVAQSVQDRVCTLFQDVIKIHRMALVRRCDGLVCVNEKSSKALWYHALE